ncbi:DMT family transporter [Mesonia sp. MT50]|uniref:DMT family transporter n=1 Tax=Mesonia profundi TaxID=3070998 RepID=A0ABU1A120_9FLAO|nr:DMT family transporter [Mesonia profundi]MDQ7917407.1 DMT family transporter [Mesonia profundi]
MLTLFKNKWFLLIIMAITWGSSFILIKKSLTVFSPYEIGAFRVGLSGIILSFIGIPALLKMKMRDALWIAAAGFFGNFLPMFLFPIAQTKVSSSLAGIINSLEPIFVLVLGFMLFGIKSKFTQIIGAIIGFFGAVTLLYFSEMNTEETQLGYTLLMVLASASYAVSALIIKLKLQEVKSIHISSSVFSIWMIPSFFILIFSGFFSTPINDQSIEALGYMGVLSIFGTAIGIALFYKLIQDTSAVFASTVSYLLPIVAVIWGVLDGEKFNFWYLIGAVLILIGIYLIREKKKKPQVTPR